MLLYRLISPKWLNKPILEGKFSKSEIKRYNHLGYNIYYFPNAPSEYSAGDKINGATFDSFKWVFVDWDSKTDTRTKDQFLEDLLGAAPTPSKIVDSGNGIHAYWRVSDLDAMSYLRLTRRLIRLLNTDPATNMICQLMRMPGTMNTKNKDKWLECYELYREDKTYTCEELDKALPPLTLEDETWCQTHYDQIYNPDQALAVSFDLPVRFGRLLSENEEAKALWAGDSDDRSRDDYRLGHIMFASDFTKEEALSVLVNSAKAMSRAPIHRVNYAQNIVNKIWTYETKSDFVLLSKSIADILKQGPDVIKGIRFACHPVIDNTARGFCLGDVIGLVGGAGIGKTAIGLNLFQWCSERNPNYHHLFVSLEQPQNEIAARWDTISGGSTALNGKVHILSNYDDNGTYRNLSFKQIKEYIKAWENNTGQKIGCVMIDHIGVLAKAGSGDDKQDLATICHEMKAFAIETKTLLIMQSQTSREKAGIGDLELDKDAAYGTTTFEWYCDYLVTLWQPLKRCHNEEGCPTVTAFKFCKIRHKNIKKDIIRADTRYYLFFDPDTERLRELTQAEEVAFKFYLPKATNLRRVDRRTEVLEYKSVPNKVEVNEAAPNRNRQH